MKKIQYKILYFLTHNKTFYNKYKYNYKLKNNKIILIKNGKEYVLPPYTYIEGLTIHFWGENNTVTMELPTKLNNSIIYFRSDNNFVHFGKNTLGGFSLNLCNNNNTVNIGERVEAAGFSCTLHGDNLIIGNNCMFSNSIKLWTDGHSVIDDKTKTLLNPPNHTIKIGDHVWIGEDVVLLKKAQIPSNSIVAHSSVVTKNFLEENIIIAGNPAKIVKKGINWNGIAPNYYNTDNVDFTF